MALKWKKFSFPVWVWKRECRTLLKNLLYSLDSELKIQSIISCFPQLKGGSTVSFYFTFNYKSQHNFSSFHAGFSLNSSKSKWKFAELFMLSLKLAVQIDKKQKAINACRQLVGRVSIAVLMLTLKYLIKES
jgi:hypothetical protein